MKLCDSNLEKKWLSLLDRRNLHLPTHAQYLVEDCSVRPDFFYKNHQTAVYIDGPIHDYPGRSKKDVEQTECMEDLGYMVIRFHYQEDWEEKIARYPNIFGVHRST